MSQLRGHLNKNNILKVQHQLKATNKHTEDCVIISYERNQDRVFFLGGGLRKCRFREQIWLYYLRCGFFRFFIGLGAAVSAAARQYQRRRKTNEETENIVCDSADAVRKTPRQAQEDGDGDAPWKHLFFLTGWAR